MMTELSPTAKAGCDALVDLVHGSQLAEACLRNGAVALAPDESSVILLQPPLPLVGVSIVMKRERQQTDSTLVNG